MKWTRELAKAWRSVRSDAVTAGKIGGTALAGTTATQALALAVGWTPRTRGWFGIGGGLVQFAGAALLRKRMPNVAMGLIAGGAATVSTFAAANPPASAGHPLCCPVIYGEQGEGIAGAMDRALPWCQANRVRFVTLHTIADEFTNNGVALTKRVRDTLGDSEVWWQLANDYHYNDVRSGRLSVADLQALRRKVALVGRDAGVSALINDCETAWTHGQAGFDETAAAEMIPAQLDAGGGAMLVGLTSFPNPAVNQEFPWVGFIASTIYSWQFYNVADGTPDSAVMGDGSAWDAYASDQHGVDRTTQLGQINPNARHVVQLQAHNNHVADLGRVADQFAQVMAWNWDLANTFAHAGHVDGLEFIAALTALDLLGFRGKHAVATFQRSKGFAPTGRLDAQTLGALVR